MRTPFRLLTAALVLVALLVPAFAPPASAAHDHAAPAASPHGGGGSGNGTSGGNSSSPLTVQVSGPPLMVAGGNATFQITVGYDAGGNATGNVSAAPTHHVTLTAQLVGANGTVTLDPAALDVHEGGFGYARAEVTIAVATLPGQAHLLVHATSADGSADGEASFLVV